MDSLFCSCASSCSLRVPITMIFWLVGCKRKTEASEEEEEEDKEEEDKEEDEKREEEEVCLAEALGLSPTNLHFPIPKKC